MHWVPAVYCVMGTHLFPGSLEFKVRLRREALILWTQHIISSVRGNGEGERDLFLRSVSDVFIKVTYHLGLRHLPRAPSPRRWCWCCSGLYPTAATAVPVERAAPGAWQPRAHTPDTLQTEAGARRAGAVRSFARKRNPSRWWHHGEPRSWHLSWFHDHETRWTEEPGKSVILRPPHPARPPPPPSSLLALSSIASGLFKLFQQRTTSPIKTKVMHTYTHREGENI